MAVEPTAGGGCVGPVVPRWLQAGEGAGGAAEQEEEETDEEELEKRGVRCGKKGVREVKKEEEETEEEVRRKKTRGMSTSKAPTCYKKEEVKKRETQEEASSSTSPSGRRWRPEQAAVASASASDVELIAIKTFGVENMAHAGS